MENVVEYPIARPTQSDAVAKWELVRKHDLCKRCLKKHGWRGKAKCRYPVICTIEECHGGHHPLLHRKTVVQPGKNEEEKQCNHQYVEGESLFKIIPVILSNGTKEVNELNMHS